MDSQEHWTLRDVQVARIVGTTYPARLRDVVAPARQLAARQRAAAPRARGTPWVSAGPRNVPGRIGCLAVDPDRPAVLYAGSAAGGVYKSTTGGASWEPLWSQQESLAIGGLAVGHDVIYAATGEWVGGPWSTQYHHFPGVGVFVSRDQGATWTPSPIDSLWTAAVAVDPTNSRRVFVAAEEALYRSTDGAISWQPVFDGTISDVVIDPTDPRRIYIGVHGRGVWRSPDGGDSWQRLAVDGDPTNGFESPKIALGREGAVAVLTRGRVFTSPDLGNTFVPRARLQSPDFDDAPLYAAWCSAIAFDPTDPGILLAGHVKLWRSGDGARSWTLVAGTNLTEKSGHTRGHDDLQAIVFDARDHAHVWAATDGGIFESVDNGRSWGPRSVGLSTTQCFTIAVSRVPPFRRGITTQDNACYQAEGDDMFDVVLDNREGGWIEYHPSDAATVYLDTRLSTGATPMRKLALGPDGAVLSSTDLSDGTGVILESEAAILEALAIARQRPDSLLLVTKTHRLLHSTDGGLHWEATLRDHEIWAVEYAPSDARHAYAAGNDGRVWHSDTGGATWSQVTRDGQVPPHPVNDIEVDPDNPLRVYLAFGANDVTFGADVRPLWCGDVTSAAASVWEDVGGDSPDVSLPPRLPITGLALDPERPGTMYASHLLGVHRTLDGGHTWIPFDDGLPNCFVSDLDLHEPTRTLFVATMGRGLYQRAI